MAERGSALRRRHVRASSARSLGRLRHRHRGAHRVRHRPGGHRHFIGAYVESLGLFGITDGWWVYLAVYAVFIGVHLMGVGEALKVGLLVAAVAVLGLLVFLVGAVTAFDPGRLLDIEPTGAAGALSFLPYGVLGVWAAFPFANLTWGPRIGRADSERNCLSNVRPPHGLGYEQAADTLVALLGAARELGASRVVLKDEGAVLPPGAG